MKKSVFKIISIITTCAILLVGALVSASIINSKNVAVQQAEKSLLYMSQKYANEFSRIFDSAELMVNDLGVFAEEEFVAAECINNRDLFQQKKKKADKVIRNAIENSKNPIGLYLTINPEMSKGKDEIWYVKRKNNEIIYMDSIPISNGWLVEDTDTTEYYFQTIREGAYWSDASYDPGMDGKVISYTKAVYDVNGGLIGVMGADILIEDIFAALEKINKEIKGYSMLIDANGNLAAGTNVQKYLSSDQYVSAQASIGDKWTIVLVQPINAATESIIKTEAMVILMGILLLIMAVLLIFHYSKKKVYPMIEAAEKKDLLMINQARQAKMGEMVGNIAHQWKQPLNSMKMALSNMQEDYEQKILEEEDFVGYIERMRRMITNLSETADDFTQFLKPGRKTEYFSVNEEIQNVINLMDERIRIQGISVDVEGTEAYLNGYRNEFSQCLFNLVDNAIDALAEAPENEREILIRISKESRVGKAKTQYHIKVFNKGKPIKEENVERLFELYFTTKADKEGTGIGLYLTKEIVENHFGGTVSFMNTSDGVLFDLCIPAEDERQKNDDCN